MKQLFSATRHSDLETVKQLLYTKPELVACTAKQPPNKDDGQSPLQVALKTGTSKYIRERTQDSYFAFRRVLLEYKCYA